MSYLNYKINQLTVSLIFSRCACTSNSPNIAQVVKLIYHKDIIKISWKIGKCHDAWKKARNRSWVPTSLTCLTRNFSIQIYDVYDVDCWRKWWKYRVRYEIVGNLVRNWKQMRRANPGKACSNFLIFLSYYVAFLLRCFKVMRSRDKRSLLSCKVKSRSCATVHRRQAKMVPQGYTN